jgi:alkylation response protein AidB-like acyl-CoA dehydrogenase
MAIDFTMTTGQSMLKQTVARLAKEKIAPRAKEIDEKAEFPWENVKALAELGIFGLTIPEKYGGGGEGWVTLTIVTEEIAKACVSTSTVLFCSGFVNFFLTVYGTEEQRQKYLPDLATGKILGGWAHTEPGSGSDLETIETKAVLEGDHYVINGLKHFISNAGSAKIYVVTVVTDKTKGLRGLSQILVDSNTKGLSIGPFFNKMGIRGSHTGTVIFDDCRVPKENILGQLGNGFMQGVQCFGEGRISVAAQAVGLAQAAYDAAREYAKQRVQYKQPIAKHQALRFMFADMAVDISAARLLTYQAAVTKDRGEDFIEQAAMAKVFAAEAAHRVVSKSLQMFGGYGYMKDLPMERYYRDQRIMEIYEGTSEMARLGIAGYELR